MPVSPPERDEMTLKISKAERMKGKRRGNLFGSCSLGRGEKESQGKKLTMGLGRVMKFFFFVLLVGGWGVFGGWGGFPVARDTFSEGQAKAVY